MNARAVALGEVFGFFARFGGDGLFVFDEFGEEFFVARGENLNGEQAGVAASADGDRCDWDAAGHLNNREKGIEALQGFTLDGNADDGKRGDTRQHSGKVRGATGSGNDDFEAAGVGGATEFNHIHGRAMGGEDLDVGVNAEFGAGLGGGFQRGPVGVAAHDDRNEWEGVSAHRS